MKVFTSYPSVFRSPPSIFRSRVSRLFDGDVKITLPLAMNVSTSARPRSAKSARSSAIVTV